MMKRTFVWFRKMWLALIPLAWVLNVQAQDPVFSQFYAAPLQLNPAFAGLTTAPSFNANYRNQWPELNRAYQTYALSYDQYFPEARSGFGGFILSDNAGNGLLKTNKIAGIYSYRIQIDREVYLKWGVEAGIVQSRLDWNSLVFVDQIDPESGVISPGGTPFPSSETPPEQFNQTYFDIGFGGLLYNPKYYLGVSLKHLNTPDQNFLEINSNLFSGIPIRFSAHAGSEITLIRGNNRQRGAFISPGLLYMRQGSFSQLNIGAFAGLNMFSVGAWFRQANSNADAVIAAVGVRSGVLRITYSYDVTISRLTTRSGGSHEIGVAVYLDPGVQESIYNDCFSIFR